MGAAGNAAPRRDPKQGFLSPIFERPPREHKIECSWERPMEILTASEVAAMLKISTRQVYQLAKETENPIPSVRIRTSVRFRKSDVDGWVAGLVERKPA